jgi:Ca2+/Na+ antiporter
MNQETTTAGTQKQDNSHRLYIVLGLLWLALAAVILVWEFQRPATIVIDWETETEFETAGFNIYRSEAVADSCDNVDDADYIQINTELIPSSADPASGAVYSFEDNNVESGTSYCYQLQDVEFSQRTERHQPFVGKTQQVQWIALIIAATSVVVGLALLIAGLKREMR